MGKPNRLLLSYTSREWIIIEKKILDMGNKNGVISHIIKEVKNLGDIGSDINNENKLLMTKIEKRQFYPPPNSFEILSLLSERLNIPPSTLVSRLIINPLLK